MKTVYQLVQEHREVIDGNRTPIFGFKVGDMVKQSPKETISGFKIKNGKVVGIDDHMVTIEFEPGSYDTDTIHELYLMPAED